MRLRWIAAALAAPPRPEGSCSRRVEDLARHLHGLGLGVPALAFAASQRPLLYIYGQCLRFLAPCLGAPAEEWAAVLEDPDSLDLFLERLEALLAAEAGRG